MRRWRNFEEHWQPASFDVNAAGCRDIASGGWLTGDEA